MQFSAAPALRRMLRGASAEQDNFAERAAFSDFTSLALCLVSRAERGPTSPFWDEARHLRRIVPVYLAQLSFHFALLAQGQAPIHEHEHREHRDGQDGGPLKEKTEHDENEANILGMPDAGIGSRRC